MMHRLQRRCADIVVAERHIVDVLEVEECRVCRETKVYAAQCRCEVSHFRNNGVLYLSILFCIQVLVLQSPVCG